MPKALKQMSKASHTYHYKPHHYPRIQNKHQDMSKPWIMQFYLYDLEKGKPTLVRHKNAKIKDYRTRERYFNLLEKRFKSWMDEGYALNAGKVQQNASDILMTTAIQEVFEYKKKVLRKNGWIDYRKFKNAFEEFQKGYPPTLYLKHFKKKDAYAFLDYLQKQRKIANKTYKNYLTTGHAILEYFVERGYIEQNPFKGIKAPKWESGTHEPFSQEQKALIFEAAKTSGDSQFFLFINFAYYTCARPHSEVRLLKVGDIKEKTLHIRAELSKNKQGLHIPIPSPLQKQIDAYNLRNHNPNHYIFTVQEKPGVEPVSEHYFYRRFRKCLEALGLAGKGHDLYSLKHSRIIFLMSKVTKFSQLKAIQDLARHSNLRQTEAYARRFGIIFPFNDEDILDLE